MSAPKMQVKCAVCNCIYNEDRYCNAGEIMVNAMGDNIAHTSDGTCCETFLVSKAGSHS